MMFPDISSDLLPLGAPKVPWSVEAYILEHVHDLADKTND
jgi:hypothetical protein